MTTSTLNDILGKALAKPKALSQEEIACLLSARDEASLFAIFKAAYSLKRRYLGNKTAFRGLLEISNQCGKDCLYCGIRRSNAAAVRYRMPPDEIFQRALEAKDAGYNSLVIQSGELAREEFARYVDYVLELLMPLEMGITLSLGEQNLETLARWHALGASRYLLRIETSSPLLYSSIHPPGHSWEKRKEVLSFLRMAGYQVGSGVMCALPGQTLRDLANDILFFGDEDLDMIGMGPYIPHKDTPLADRDTGFTNRERLDLGLKMIAAARLYLHDVNIASSTALEALDKSGRELGILAGANVIMPNITPHSLKEKYSLYEGKPVSGDDIASTIPRLQSRLRQIGEELLLCGRGDSLHYKNRTNRKQA